MRTVPLAVLVCLLAGAAAAQRGEGGFPPLPTTKPPPLPASPGGVAPAVAGKPGAPAAPSSPPAPAPAPAGTGRQISSGTGFVIGAARVLTNNHVIEDCRGLRVRTASGLDLGARVLAADRTRDLALLETQGDAGPALAFRQSAGVRRGEGVVTYGFPLAGLLSSGPTLTTGEVSALAGIGDNPRQFQISAPVQPGNSGGPLLDMNGNVVGIVVSKLNALRVAQRTGGDIPQNVNFAVKHTEAIEFLRGAGVSPRLAASSGAGRGAAEVGEVAHPSTLFVRCLG